MRTTSGFSDYQPIRYLGRVPIYATTVITALMGVGVFAFALLHSMRMDPSALLGFSPSLFLRGWFWQPLSYVFVASPSFFTVFSLWCFYSWAMEGERYLGRARFLKLFAALVLAQPILCGLWRLGTGADFTIAGSYEITAAFLVAFATLYPNIEYFGWIPLKWFAFACCAIGSLMYFSDRNWVGLSFLWVELGVAFGFIRLIQQGGSVEFGDLTDKLNVFKRRPKFRVVSPSASSQGRSDQSEASREMDALLDKIAKSGLASLTDKERSRLEAARAELLKRGR